MEFRKIRDFKIIKTNKLIELYNIQLTITTTRIPTCCSEIHCLSNYQLSLNFVQNEHEACLTALCRDHSIEEKEIKIKSDAFAIYLNEIFK